jgi:hypothetical protein
MRGGGEDVQGKGADECEAIGRRTTRQEEWGGGHNAGQLGVGWHDKRGGGRAMHARWWLTASGSGGRGCTQDVLEIAPQNCTSNCAKNPWNIGFSEKVRA